ncbi:MAG: hypothetical protein ACE15B_14205 [Bryobacteraceae bacterium]
MELGLVLFGGLFCIATAYALGAVLLRRSLPRTTIFATGAAALSLVVFLLLCAGAANRWTFAATGIASLAGWAALGRKPEPEPAVEPADRVTRALAAAIFTAFGLFYALNALAPESTPDGITYHLGLVSEYARLGRFPDRVGFFEMLPQGLEMLFLFAFPFGRHSAAKLVEFAFLLATPALMLHVARRLGLPDRAGLAAGVLYFAMPVAGVAGTSSYNDAGLVFFTVAAFYLLLRDEYALAGVAAGFCYAVKFSGIVTVPLAAVYALNRRGRRGAVAVCAAGAVMMVPWLLRNTLLAENPFAPLFNGWFPNGHFHVASERILARALATYGGVTLANAPAELAFGWRLQGLVGPLLLLLPLGLLALRRPAGRLLWLAGAALALPWFWNIGARFLMPALPFLWLALAMALPRSGVWALMLAQAVLCWPAVAGRYSPQAWRLKEWPWKAALRLESEAEYLSNRLDEYKVARMVNGCTRPGERIFALMSVASAFTGRESLVFWHSADADRLLDALRTSGEWRDPLFDVAGQWPAEPLRALRVRLEAGAPVEWCIHELRVYRGDEPLRPGGWTLTSSVNRWEASLAADGNLATRWRTWEPARAGIYMEIDFGGLTVVNGAGMISHTPLRHLPFTYLGRGADGRWRTLDAAPAVTRRAPEELRPAATRALARAGFQYILAPTEDEGLAPLGARMAVAPAEWNLETACEAGSVRLFRIR